MRVLAIVLLSYIGVLSRSVDQTPQLVEFDWGEEDPGSSTPFPDEENALECLCVFDDSVTSTLSFPAPVLPT